MCLRKAESTVYAAGIAIQANQPPRQGVRLRQLVEVTGYAMGTVHKAVRGLQKKRMVGWPLKEKNRRMGGLRFWDVRRKSA